MILKRGEEAKEGEIGETQICRRIIYVWIKREEGESGRETEEIDKGRGRANRARLFRKRERQGAQSSLFLSLFFL